jgi:hypothetical protein
MRQHNGSWQTITSLSVPYNTYIDYIVSKQYYDTNQYMNYGPITGNETLPITIFESNYTLTIVPKDINGNLIPNCTILIGKNGGTLEETNTITAKNSDVISYQVSKEGYFTERNDNYHLTRNESKTVTLEVGSELYLDDYSYTNNNRDVILNDYIGTDTEIVTPHIGE